MATDLVNIYIELTSMRPYVLIMLRELGLVSSQELIFLVGLMEAEIADRPLTDAALKS